MRVVYSYKDVLEEEKIFGDDIIVGRPEGGVAVDLDLKFDPWVSHRHARIWLKDGQYWIEDLGSRNGTLVNGEKIQSRSSRRLVERDVIEIGDTTLRVTAPGDLPRVHERSRITLTLDGNKSIYSIEDTAEVDNKRHLAILYELPLQLGGEIKLDPLLQMIVAKLLEVIRDSARAALVLRDPSTNTLLLKAHLPWGKPYVSMTLAQRALDERVGFIWEREKDPTATQADDTADCAMYAPLLWKGKALGAAVVDNYEKTRVFKSEDLKLLMAVAQHAAMAVANQTLQEELCRESAIRSNLLRQFSPKIAERLLSHRGQLRLGGERCSATILFADIRGFSQLSQTMDPESVVELLNYYFSGLIPVLFSLDGSVEKYVGDAVVAVFGSPEADPQHFEKGLRAAVGMQEKMGALNAVRQARGDVTCGIGIGVHCGEVVQGFIGMPEQMNFACIGDPMNRTARYCEAAKAGEVLISPELYEHVWRIVHQAEPVTVDSKGGQQLSAYRVTKLWD
jgi:adenylate cyclase